MSIPYTVTGTATNGNDFLISTKGNDTISGNNGNDIIFVGKGDDYIHGGPGNDKLFGDSGDDLLSGGKGTDMLTGGSGHDTFVFGRDCGVDKVTDFQHSSTTKDTLDISDIQRNYNPATEALSDFVKFTGNADGTCTMKVNADGHGSSFHDVAVISFNLSALSVDSLVADGALVVT